MTGRPEDVVGWYHSHPGFGCWLSGVDVRTMGSRLVGGARTNAKLAAGFVTLG